MKPIIVYKQIKKGLLRNTIYDIKVTIRQKSYNEGKVRYRITDGIDVVIKHYTRNIFTNKKTLVNKKEHLYSKKGKERVILVDVDSYSDAILIKLENIFTKEKRQIKITYNS